MPPQHDTQCINVNFDRQMIPKPQLVQSSQTHAAPVLTFSRPQGRYLAANDFLQFFVPHTKQKNPSHKLQTNTRKSQPHLPHKTRSIQPSHSMRLNYITTSKTINWHKKTITETVTKSPKNQKSKSHNHCNAQTQSQHSPNHIKKNLR
ncbi:hypothetical protein M758_2G110400, partial [Ceratodon purpureus]